MLTVGGARKLFNTIGLLGSTVPLVALGFVSPNNILQAVILLICSVGVTAACMSGWSINHIDLSPNHAGTLMGITNGVAHIPAIVAPLLVQIFVKDQVVLLLLIHWLTPLT